MVGLIILGIIVGIIVIILVIPIGADINYEGGELRVSAKVWKFLIQLIPKAPPDPDKPPKEKKPKKPKKVKKKKPKEKPEGEEAMPKKKLKLNFSFDEIMAILKKLFKGLGKIFTIHVDRFMLHFVAAGSNPYDTAMTYNYVNAALSALAPICDRKYKCRDTDVWTDIDFTQDKMQIDAGIAITIRLGQILHGVNIILFGALGILIKNKIRLFFEKLRTKKDKTVNDDEVIKIEENEKVKKNKKENIQEDERIE